MSARRVCVCDLAPVGDVRCDMRCTELLLREGVRGYTSDEERKGPVRPAKDVPVRTQTGPQHVYHAQPAFRVRPRLLVSPYLLMLLV